jgi:DNA-binding MarR family transcriptional regulator
MTKSQKSNALSNASAESKATPTKHQQIIDLLLRDGGATLNDMSTEVGWLPHSTRAFMTGLKKKGYVIESNKVEDVRRYRIITTSKA